MLFIRILAFTIALTTLLVSCSKGVERRVYGKLRNCKGIDGCGWLIELKEKDVHGAMMLEPLNLNKFRIQLEEGQEIVCSYIESPSMSVCMAGTIVELKSIHKKH
ncbi:MAG: hypothetical protein WCR21_03635 [Bacteroidota bacterium]